MHAKTLQLLRRLVRKGSVPRDDARRVCCEAGSDVGGDGPIDAALSYGFAIERKGVLWLTDAGRRAVAAQ